MAAMIERYLLLPTPITSLLRAFNMIDLVFIKQKARNPKNLCLPWHHEVGQWADLLQLIGYSHCWFHFPLPGAQIRTALQPYFWRPPRFSISTIPWQEEPYHHLCPQTRPHLKLTQPRDTTRPYQFPARTILINFLETEYSRLFPDTGRTRIRGLSHFRLPYWHDCSLQGVHDRWEESCPHS